MSLMHTVLAALAVLVLIGLWTAQKSTHPFDIRDTLMDAQTGKASLNALILALAFALSTWVVIDRENDGKDDVPELLLGVLGIFVLGRLGAQTVAAFKPGPEAGATVEQTIVRTETTTTPPPVAKAPPMPDPITKPKRKR